MRDDAIWAEETDGVYRVSVSIADVAALVVPFSGIDQRAYQRGFTHYKGAGTELMLPEGVIRSAILGRREQRAITVIVTLGHALDIKETRVVPSLLKNVGNLSFEDADRIGAGCIHPLAHELRLMRDLTERLRSRRRSSGALILDRLDDGCEDSTEKAYTKWLLHTRALSSNRIVEEFILLASNALALWCLERGVPILYRNHTTKIREKQRERLLRDIDRAYAGDMPPPEFKSLHMRVRMLYHKAYYGPLPEGHGALNMLHTHWSSPLHRYPDLLVHQAIQAELRGEQHVRTNRVLTSIASHINVIKRELNIEQYQKEYYRADYKTARRSRAVFIRELRFRAREEPWLDDILKWNLYLRTRSGNDSEMAYCVLIFARCGGILWRSAKRDVLRSLAERSRSVRSVFERAHVELRWPLPIIETKEDAQGRFMGVARIELPGENFAAVSEWLPDKELAMDEAVFSLLGIVSKLPDSAAEENLGRYCSACGLRAPRYSVSQCTEGSRPSRCIARTSAPHRKIGVVGVAYAAEDAEARSRAANTLLTRLIFEAERAEK